MRIPCWPEMSGKGDSMVHSQHAKSPDEKLTRTLPI